MNRDRIFPLLWTVLMIVGVIAIVRYLWPLLLIAILAGIALYLRERRKAQKILEQYQQTQNQHVQAQTVQDVEDQLFAEQLRRKTASGEVIDAEFEPVEQKGNQ